ncbi:MAG: MFS transporter, partial [Hyphomicrobiaceae bacterium]|nr:MFS transporter [Hyphomicrobiaceae bacterium]
SLMLVFGRLGDLMGYRPLFQLGLVVNAGGLVACAAAPSYTLLLLGRMVQGVGIALTLSCAPALAISLYEERNRARVLGIYAAIHAAGSALGPLVGGYLVDCCAWPAVFWGRVPLVLAALALSWRLRSAPMQGQIAAFDVAGAALLVTWMSALLLALSLATEPSSRAIAGALLGIALLTFTTFLLCETRRAHPLIRVALFRDARFAAMNLASIAVNLTAFGVLLLVPYYLLRVARLDTGVGGIVLACGAGGTVLGAWLAGRLAGHVRIGQLALTGVLLGIAGLWAISTWTAATPLSTLSLALLLQGLGVGLFQVAYTDLVIAALPSADRGVAGSLTILTRTVGVVGGASALSAAFQTFELRAVRAGVPMAEAFLDSFQATFGYAAAALALCLAISLLRPRVWA